MVKSGKSFVRIGSRLKIALFFLFYRNFHCRRDSHNVSTVKSKRSPQMKGIMVVTSFEVSEN